MGEVGCRLLERQILELEMKNEKKYTINYDYVSYDKV